MQRFKRKIRRMIMFIIKILIMMTLLVSNSSLVLAEEIMNQMTSEEVNATIEMNISKYSNYNIHENKGTLLQINVKTGIQNAKDENCSAIKRTTTLLKVPEINGQLPIEAKVVVKSTKLTNGQENSQVSDSYDAEKGILQIVTSNDEEERYNTYEETAKDEYEVILKYAKEAYAENNEPRNLEVEAVTRYEFHEEEIKPVIQTQEYQVEVREEIGKVISSDLQIEDIYDGYIKANQQYGTNYETTYQEKASIFVSEKELQDTLKIEQENNIPIGYKKTRISKSNLKEILGEEGSIKILKEDGSLIQEINKDTEEVEDGMVEITYEENTEKIVLQTSKPRKEGELSIIHTKAILPNQEETISKVQVTQKITSIKKIENQEMPEEQLLETTEITKEIQKAESNMEMSMDNPNLTNETTNNVLLTATLKANESKYDLYKNPSLQIELPNEVEKVVLGDISIVYGDGFEVTKAEVIENALGNKVIKIELAGVQTAYMLDSINSGINVLIPASLVLKKEINTTSAIIKTSYTNESIANKGYKTAQGVANDLEIAIVKATEYPEEEKTNYELAENQKTQNVQTNGKLLEESGLELTAYAQVGDKKLNNGDSIHDTEIIKYVVSVKNTTQTTMKNIDITCQIPENTAYATINLGTFYQEDYTYEEEANRKEYSFLAETLEPGETKVGFYEVVVKSLEENTTQKEITNQIKATMGKQEVATVTLDNVIVISKVRVYLRSYIGRDTKNSFYYYLDVENTTSQDMGEVKIEMSELQKEMEIIDAIYYEDETEENLQTFGNWENGKLEGVIPSIAAGQTRTILIKVKAQNFDENVNEVPLKMIVKANLQSEPDDIYYSNENRRNAYPEYVTVNMTSDKEGEEVKAGEIVTYQLEIKNPSKIKTYISIEDILPREVEGIKLIYHKYNIEEESTELTEYDIEAEANLKYTLEKVEKDLENIPSGEADLDEYVVILAGKSLTMTFTGKTIDVVQTTEVSNYATVKGNYIKTVTSNIVKFTLVSPYSNTDDNNSGNGGNGGDNSDNNNVGQPHTISGVVWKDDNRDGKRDNNEELMSGIQVKLYNVTTKTLEKKENQTAQMVVTDAQGRYIFQDVENGEYWILFEYNTSAYALTAYQKGGVPDALNSDAISKEVSIDGITKKVGITDTLRVQDNGLSNIDMGLISNTTFDLRLDKYISKIDVQTTKGNKVYNYENTQFAKIEMKAKELKNSMITIEYTIKVTNEGDVEGFASQIVDYIPEGYNFDTSINKGWVQNRDGSLVNKTLSNEFINPGESKELTLILTKQMTEDSTGTVINAAEIAESKNSYNLPDQDSTAGNKAEDDYSEAELLISIETGILTYTLITFIAVGGLLLIAFAMKRKINPFKRRGIKNGLRIFGITLFVVSIVSGDAFARVVDIRRFLDDNNNQHFYEANGTNIAWGSPEYYCGDTGMKQCHWASHWYNLDNPDITTEAVTSTNKSNSKDVKITGNESKVDTIKLDKNYNLVGPYTIQSNSTESSIKAIRVVYEEEGKTKETSDITCLVDNNGKQISLGMEQNQNKTFYLKVSSRTEKINSLTIEVQVENAIKVVNSLRQRYTYSCIGTEGGYVHKLPAGYSEREAVSAGQVQSMYIHVTGTSESTEATSESVEFGEVEIRGSFDLLKTDEDSKKPLPNVQFTMKMTDGKEKGKYVKIDKNGNAVYSNEKETIKTDNAGKIKIDLLLPGTYELVETDNPIKEYGELPRTIDTNLVIKPGKNTSKTVTNQRKYISLSGMVWEDLPWEDGKEEYANELYKEKRDALDTKDRLVNGISVQLRKKGQSAPLQTTTTNSQGEYKFTNVEINQIPNYYIEFIYNGMVYESVSVKGLELENATKAIEGDNRTTFNNQYAQIAKEEARDENGAKTYDLTYNKEDYKSTIEYTPSSQYEIKANTYNAYEGYLEKIITPDQIHQQGITEIEHINLGIKKREQPDLSLIKDIESAKVSINGTEHIYKYADRFTNKATYGDGYTMEPTVKFGQKYGNMSYTRALYASDIKYTGNDNDQLEVKVTYKIGIRNNSTNLNVVVRQLDDYFDSKYELEEVGTAIEDDASIKAGTEIQHSNPSSYAENYQKLTIQTNLSVNALEEGYVYVQLKVKPEHIIDIIDQGEDVKLDNVTEITAYSIEDKDGKAYAGIDIDSQPGNLDLNDIKTFEDDTDKAPGLLIILQEARTITGNVFEDGTTVTDGIRQGNGTLDDTEQGIEGVEVTLLNQDGTTAKIYDDATEIWKDASSTTDVNGEYEISGLLPGEYKIRYTWGDGTHKVQDYKSTIVDKESYEAKQTNLEWYKDEFKENYLAEWQNGQEVRRSDAVDDYALRENIDNETSEITNSVKEKIENSYNENTPEEDKFITKMNSTTPDFIVNLEYNSGITNGTEEYETNEDGTIKIENGYVVKKDGHKNTLKSIDFGIAQRASQTLQLDKRVTAVKISLADGSTLINTEINEDGELVNKVKYASYIPKSQGAKGQVKLELDSELIQSATLEISYGFKVTNISEIEYLNQNFYQYGQGYGENENDIVTLTPAMIIDYLDNSIEVQTIENQNWNFIQDNTAKKQLMENGLLSNTQEMKELLNQRNRITTTDKFSGENLTPIEGENTVEGIAFKGYRLLANSADEILLDNDAEIIKVIKNGGSTLTTIPGNYIPGNSETSEPDNANSESLTIIPPTGLNTDIIAWTILIASSLGILATGIILIKKYVLKR